MDNNAVGMDKNQFPDFEGMAMITIFNDDFFYYPEEPSAINKVKNVVDILNVLYPAPNGRHFVFEHNQIGIIIYDMLAFEDITLSYRQTQYCHEDLCELLCIEFDLLDAVSDDEDGDDKTVINESVNPSECSDTDSDVTHVHGLDRCAGYS